MVLILTHPQTKKINVTGSGVDLGKSYMQFVRNNMDTITKRINDDLWVLNVMEKWYFDQVQMISTWLTDRLDKTLIPYQCTCLAHVVKVGGGQEDARWGNFLYKLWDFAETLHRVRAAGDGGGEAEHPLLPAGHPAHGHGGGHLRPQQRGAGREWVSRCCVVTCHVSRPRHAAVTCHHLGSDEEQDEKDRERRRKQIENIRRAKAAGHKFEEEEGGGGLQRQQSRAGPGPGQPGGRPPPQRAPSQQQRGGPPQNGPRGPPGPGQGKPPPQQQGKPKPKKMDSDDDSSDSDDGARPPPKKGPPPKGAGRGGGPPPGKGGQQPPPGKGRGGPPGPPQQAPPAGRGQAAR